jgi:hypothetical protein
MLQKKNSCKQLGDEKKFVHRKIAHPPPPLKYLMVRPLGVVLHQQDTFCYNYIEPPVNSFNNCYDFR